MSSEKKTALISVYDKSGVKELAQGLYAHGVQILATGNTFALLQKEKILVREVSEVTGFPEILDGRVKTLHPVIHAGILAKRSKPEHLQTLSKMGITAIDFVIVNLYPFEQTPTIENIDIGGPTMVRAAAKNYEGVTIVTDPADYPALLEELGRNNGATSEEFRKKMAAKAFAMTALYESAIAGYFGNPSPWPSPLMGEGWGEGEVLRYGENPHQKAWFYRDPNVQEHCVANARQLQGKGLSFNNILDADAAIELVKEFQGEPACAAPVCAIIKHTNPCGVGRTFEEAYACDSLSAFGGIVAFNRPVDGLAAKKIAETFFEVIIAPDFSPEALEVFGTKKNLRVLVVAEDPRLKHSGMTYDSKKVVGGLLIQERDAGMLSDAGWKVVTKREPTPAEKKACLFAWKVAKHVKSNAVVLANETQTIGIGAGQMSRVDAVRLAVQKIPPAGVGPLEGGSVFVAASDGFFPFPDGVEDLAKANVTAVIQPGGSIKDAEVIACADQNNLAMIFTGQRHFRH